MAFLAPAAAAGLGTAAASTAIPGMVGATLAAPGVAAMTTGAGAALGTGLAAGAGTAGTIFGATSLGIPGLMGGMGALGGAGSAGSVLGLGGAGLGGAGSALGATGLKAAGTTAALEGAKSSIISTAMQNQAMQNAMMQNMAGGIASPAAQTVASMGLNPGQQAFLNASTAGPGAPVQMLGPKVNIPANSVGNGWGSYTMDGANRTSFLTNPAQVTPTPPVATPTAVPQVAPTAPTSPYDLSLGYKSGIDPRFVGSEGIQPVTSVTPDPTAIMGRGIRPGQNFMQNLGNIGSFQDVKDYVSEHPYASTGMGLGAYQLLKPKQPKPPEQSPGMIRPYTFDYNPNPQAYDVSPTADSSERLYFNPVFTAQTPYEAPGPEYEKASGGLAAAYAVGGPVEQMSAMNSVGANTGYPMANINTPLYANPMMQRPEATNVIAPSADAGVGAYSGEARFNMGGISHLGGYSDGGRLLKGPGDGVSDSIPASIGNRQPARLADGEFVVPARIVSEIGNGSTEAGARKLYAMMDRVQKARKKSVGKGRVAVNTKADKHLPA